MKHSELLILRNSLLKLDMDGLTDEAIKRQYDLSRIMDDFPDDDVCSSLDNLMDATLSMTNSMSMLTLQYIAEINIRIRESTYKHIGADNKYWATPGARFKTAEYIREYQQLKISEDSVKIIKSRIGSYTDCNYPALEIGPGDGVWTGSLVACDPLYLVDYNDEFLTSTKQQFSPKYQKRLRCYINRGNGLYMLPQGQFGFVFSWNTFNYFSLNQICIYLEDIHKVLRKGGACMFSYNNAELPLCAKRGEEQLMSFIPKSILFSIIEDRGFVNIKTEDVDSSVSWIEFRKAGKLTSNRVGQTLGKIILASHVKV